LCNTAIDNPSKLSSGDIVDRVSSYLETDTVLHREDPGSELGKLQEQLWGGVVDWFHSYLEVQPSDGRISPSDSPLGVPEIPERVLDRFKRYLNAGDVWALHGKRPCHVSKSEYIVIGRGVDYRCEDGKIVCYSRGDFGAISSVFPPFFSSVMFDR
jgi:hypothetical protein